MEVGSDIIGVVKTNTKGFYRDTIQNLTNDWTVGSCLLLKSKPMVSGVRPLISIVYNYNAQKVLSFVDTENTGITNAGITYLFNHPNPFYNVPVLPFLSSSFHV